LFFIPAEWQVQTPYSSHFFQGLWDGCDFEQKAKGRSRGRKIVQLMKDCGELKVRPEAPKDFATELKDAARTRFYKLLETSNWLVENYAEII